jgi:hypothetical protein
VIGMMIGKAVKSGQPEVSSFNHILNPSNNCDSLLIGVMWEGSQFKSLKVEAVGLIILRYVSNSKDFIFRQSGVRIGVPK